MTFKKLNFFLKKGAAAPQVKASDKAGPKEELVREVLESFCHGLEPNFKIKHKTLYVSSSRAALKSELFLKKSEILEKLKDVLGRDAPDEINFRRF